MATRAAFLQALFLLLICVLSAVAKITDYDVHMIFRYGAITEESVHSLLQFSKDPANGQRIFEIVTSHPLRIQLELITFNRHAYEAFALNVTNGIRDSMLAGESSRKIAASVSMLDKGAVDQLAALGEIGKQVLSYHLRRLKRHKELKRQFRRLNWRLMHRCFRLWIRLPTIGRRRAADVEPADDERALINAIQTGHFTNAQQMLYSGYSLPSESGKGKQFGLSTEPFVAPLLPAGDQYGMVESRDGHAALLLHMIRLGAWPSSDCDEIHVLLDGLLERGYVASTLPLILGSAQLNAKPNNNLCSVSSQQLSLVLRSAVRHGRLLPMKLMLMIDPLLLSNGNANDGDENLLALSIKTGHMRLFENLVSNYGDILVDGNVFMQALLSGSGDRRKSAVDHLWSRLSESLKNTLLLDGIEQIPAHGEYAEAVIRLVQHAAKDESLWKMEYQRALCRAMELDIKAVEEAIIKTADGKVCERFDCNEMFLCAVRSPSSHSVRFMLHKGFINEVTKSHYDALLQLDPVDSSRSLRKLKAMLDFSRHKFSTELEWMQYVDMILLKTIRYCQTELFIYLASRGALSTASDYRPLKKAVAEGCTDIVSLMTANWPHYSHLVIYRRYEEFTLTDGARAALLNIKRFIESADRTSKNIYFGTYDYCDDEQMLINAAAKGHTEIAELFMKACNKSYKLNLIRAPVLALIEAAKAGHLSTVRMLIRHGVFPGYDCLSLRAAAQNGHDLVVRALLEEVDKKRINVHAVDDEALFLAVVNGHFVTVQVLLGFKATASARNHGILRSALEQLENDRRMELESQMSASDKRDLEYSIFKRIMIISFLIEHYENANIPDEIIAELLKLDSDDGEIIRRIIQKRFHCSFMRNTLHDLVYAGDFSEDGGGNRRMLQRLVRYGASLDSDAFTGISPQNGQNASIIMRIASLFYWEPLLPVSNVPLLEQFGMRLNRVSGLFEGPLQILPANLQRDLLLVAIAANHFGLTVQMLQVISKERIKTERAYRWTWPAIGEKTLVLNLLHFATIIGAETSLKALIKWSGIDVNSPVTAGVIWDYRVECFLCHQEDDLAIDTLGGSVSSEFIRRVLSEAGLLSKLNVVEGMTAIHFVSREDEKLLGFLVAAHASGCKRDLQGGFPLLHQLTNGQEPHPHLFLASVACLNHTVDRRLVSTLSKPADGMTLFHLASTAKSVYNLRLFLADPCLEDADGRTPIVYRLQLTSINGSHKEIMQRALRMELIKSSEKCINSGAGETPLMLSIQPFDNETMEQILQVPGLLLDRQNPRNGYTALMYAVQSENYDAVKRLREAGADFMHVRSRSPSLSAWQMADNKVIRKLLLSTNRIIRWWQHIWWASRDAKEKFLQSNK